MADELKLTDKMTIKKQESQKIVSGDSLSATSRAKRCAVYVKRLPPCNKACPAGENIQAWLYHLRQKDFKSAFDEIVKNNPFPASMGRLCYHHCESNCNRVQFDSAVNIHALERFIGDLAIKENWPLTKSHSPTGKKVLIVGAGAAGLSAAYHLCRCGHEVTIYEAEPFKGGMMHAGIPAYRLPRHVIDYEVKRIEKLGVNIECNHPVHDLLHEIDAIKSAKLDALFLGIGAWLSKTAPLESDCSIPVFTAIDFLKHVELKTLPKFGNNLIVYGGGNTAIDVARCAIRLGIKDVHIVYRRDKKHMPAFASEFVDAAEEGVKIHFLRTIKSIRNRQLELEIMRIGNDEKAEGTGNYEIMIGDAMVFALGQDPPFADLEKIAGLTISKGVGITVDQTMMTGIEGVFAGGDAVAQERSVTIAIGHGKKAARYIDAFLNKTTADLPPEHELADFTFLNLSGMGKIARAENTNQSAKDRINNFGEVVNGLKENEVKSEILRCFSCGNCFKCDLCYKSCPVRAIEKNVGQVVYNIRPDKCVGCGVCVRRCPCGAIKINKE